MRGGVVRLVACGGDRVGERDGGTLRSDRSVDVAEGMRLRLRGECREVEMPGRAVRRIDPGDHAAIRGKQRVVLCERRTGRAIERDLDDAEQDGAIHLSREQALHRPDIEVEHAVEDRRRAGDHSGLLDQSELVAHL